MGRLVQRVEGQPAAGGVDRVVPAVLADLGRGQPLQGPRELAAQPKYCQSSKLVLSRRLNPARKSPRCSRAASASGARQAGQASVGGWPWSRQPATSSSNRVTSSQKPDWANPTVVRSAASHPGPTALLRVDRVRRNAPLACSVS